MVLKLYGRNVAGVVRLVTVARVLREKKVPYEFIKNGHKSAEHLEKEPFRQVPYTSIVCDVL
jgi:glutathione S-transferase